MSLQNPLREGVKTRLRIASKLCNAADPNPFVFSEPVPLRELPSQGNNSLQPTAFDDLFVNAINTRVNIYSDGTLISPQRFKDNAYYPEYDPYSRNIATARRAKSGDLFSTNTSRLYGPAQDTISQWSNFLSDWPMFNSLLENLGWNAPGKALPSIMCQSNLNAPSLSTLMLASPFGGMRSTSLLTQQNWNLAKTLGGWSTSYLNRVEAPVKILSVVYNNQSYMLKSNIHGGKAEYHLMGQYIKVVTDHGTAIFYVIAFVANTSVASPRTTVEMYELCGLSTINDSVNGAIIPRFPYLNPNCSVIKL